MYEVTVKLTDYLGRQYTLVRRITVKENDIPIIEEPFVPRYVVNGKPVVFDGFVAYDYASTSGYPQETDRKSIRIYDEKMQLLQELDYSDRSYTPDIANGGEIVVEYRAACLYDAKKVALFQKRVTVLEADEIADYFHDGEGKTRQEPQETSVVYYTEEEGAGREFINALPATGFSFTFTVPLAANNFDRWQFGWRTQKILQSASKFPWRKIRRIRSRFTANCMSMTRENPRIFSGVFTRPPTISLSLR